MSSVFYNVEKYKEAFALKWEKIRDGGLSLPKYSKNEQKTKQNEIDQALDNIFNRLEEFPESEPEKSKQLDELKISIVKWAKKHLDLQNQDMEGEMFGGIMDVTEKFINAAKEFDSTFQMIDIMQAMRNVWIMNILQLFAGIKVQYTPAIFAYSMLYPYTDNYLDNPEISDEDKNRFNLRLSRRLEGENVTPENDLEEKIFSLVGMIEVQYPRDEYQGVFDSILSIQNGQIKSLNQQSDKSLGMDTLARISSEKGGTSVLADTYLVCGELDDEMFEFAFGFGFLLQLIDDMQDAAEDKKNGHMTVFSKLAGNIKLDALAGKLIVFVNDALDYEKGGKGAYSKEIKKMITDNCILMIFEAVGKNRKFFSRKYLRFVDSHSQISLKYFRKTGRTLKKRMKSLSSKDILRI